MVRSERELSKGVSMVAWCLQAPTTSPSATPTAAPSLSPTAVPSESLAEVSGRVEEMFVGR